MPEDWRDVLAHCDFQLAAKEIADFFAASEREAAARGQQAVYKEEFVVAWQAFAQQPNHPNAVRFIECAGGSSAMWSYFVECCPGGRFFLYKSLLGGKKPDVADEERT